MTKNPFKVHDQNAVKFLCITEDKKEEKPNEFITVKNPDGSEETVEIARVVVGLGDHIPLWNKNVTLKWRFSPLFDTNDNLKLVKQQLRFLIRQAISKWGDAAPIQFQETSGDFDFEVVTMADNCNAEGACSLASAFFPNSDQNKVVIFPRLFTLETSKQVDTIAHEMGHIFGLRHFFAQEKEGQWQSEIFGHHNPLTIMNYGELSTLTEQDKADLKRLYSLVWSGELNDINGLPVDLFSPFTQS